MTEALPGTQSLCPVCLRSLPARREARGHEVWLLKHCPEHGAFETLIWRGPPDMRTWSRPKIPYSGGPRQIQGDRGCPWDCGLCSRHSQRTCTAVLEVTSRCDLGCPVCFASSRVAAPAAADPSKEHLRDILERVHARTGGCNLQISGGEPTMRADLPELVEAARLAGFGFVQLNSNGVNLAADPELALRLAGAGLSSLFLQFDGLRPSDHLALRGRDLSVVKRRAVENAGRAGLGVVLVPTIKAGVNGGQLWEMVRFGLKHSPVVRGVHFQPMAFLGRYPEAPDPKARVTLPQIMRGLDEQSGGKIKMVDFSPPGCEHSLCSFSARYLVNPDKSLTRLGACQACGAPPQPAVRGALRSIGATARQWSGQSQSSLIPPVPAPQDDDPFASFLQRVRTHGFTVSGMAFQDAWTLDLERLRGCCIHVAADEGRLVPFCAYNLSAANGRTPHRQRSWA
jgi:uncharacterized radical SAM superfamily Fe-S cluster-containing enzyme